jgi:carboxyl-terminal processing protease
LITRVFENGPAEESGLSMGDYIVKVDGIDIGSWDLPEVSTKIKGEEGTSVSVTVRSRNDKLNDFLVSRRKITISSVEGVVVDQNHTGYLRLVQFTSRSGKECSDAIAELLEMGMKSLVLDLRDNSGGLLSAAVEIADLFLPRDQLIVTIKGRDENEVRNYRCRSVPVLPDLPVAVLMNEGSASASEIVGGALSVSGRAKVVGEQSFGKGSVQTIFPTENQSGLRLTTAMYFLPDGSTIHEQGVTPDILVECSDENESKLRIQRHSLDIMDREEFKLQFDFAPISDVQLLEAKKLLLIESDKKNVKNI